MKKYSPAFLLSLLFLGIFTSCGVEKHPYRLATPSQYEKQLSDKRYARFIIIEDHFSPELREGLRDTYRFGADALSDEAERNFFEGILYLKAKQYEKALQNFPLATEKEAIFQAKLLKVDCLRELDTEGREDFYYAYQKLYDEAPDQLMREIIKSRFKYYKYSF